MGKGAAKSKRHAVDSAEAFLKNGNKGAAKALKKNAKQAATGLKKNAKKAAYPVVQPLVISTARKHNSTRRPQPRPHARPDPTLVVKEAVAKSKHQTYYEIVENTEKKKKLEFEVTDREEPPPGFTFIPVGQSPELTKKCKELSRDQDCMIFVVSATGEKKADVLTDHTHRLGYHFRSSIVDEASQQIPLHSVRRGGVNILQSARHGINNEIYYPLPGDQIELNLQADRAIRDLFPRIPNTDRQQIIDHAFQLGATFRGQPVVGLTTHLPLARRVQLAVLAHIRHTHTRYDKLLRETDWATARATIEATCLEVIVKWRGDEETGRDQMEEVLREVVVISDSEESDSDETADDEDYEADEIEVAGASSKPDVVIAEVPLLPNSSDNPQASLKQSSRPECVSLLSSPSPAAARITEDMLRRRTKETERKAKRAERRGFKRYQEVWKNALSRHQGEPNSFHGHRAPGNSGPGAGHRTGLYDRGPPVQSSQLGDPSRRTPPRQATLNGGEFIDLTDSPYVKKVIHGSHIEGPSHFRALEQHELRFERNVVSHPGQQHQSLVRERCEQLPLTHRPGSPPSRSNLQDYLLPSIEQGPDRAFEDRRNLPEIPRVSDAAERHRLQALARGLNLMSDGTYLDAQGVLRNEEGRRIIFIDDNNRELPQNYDLSRGFVSNQGEALAARPVASKMASRHVAVDGRSSARFDAARSPGQVVRESYPISLEVQPRGDLREIEDIRHQSSMTLQPEFPSSERHSTSSFLYPRLRNVPQSHFQRPGEFSHLVHSVHRSNLSRFPDQRHGTTHEEEFSHSSAKPQESAIYGQNDSDEPILISERRNGTVTYFREPLRTRPQFEDSSAAPVQAFLVQQHGDTSKRNNSEYKGVDRPTSEFGRNISDRHAPQTSFDGTAELVPPLPLGSYAYERAPDQNSRTLPIRQDVAGHNYSH